MQEVVDLNVCPCIISDRPVSSNDWHRPVKPSLSSLRARLQNYRTVILRSICSEKKTYFRNSRVSLPRKRFALTEQRAAKSAVPWFNWPTSRNVRSSTHYRSTGYAIRCCVRSSSTESRYIDYILAIAVHFDLTHVKSAAGQYQIASQFCSSSILQHPARHSADAINNCPGQWDSTDARNRSVHSTIPLTF